MLTTSTVINVFILLAAFQVKHYVADFPLQREYMLRKARLGWSFLPPLMLHCGVHATLTFIITLYVNPELWWLALVDFCIHFTMDRIKASPNYLGRFNDLSRPSYWNAFGLDQMVHHFTHYFLIWMLITR